MNRLYQTGIGVGLAAGAVLLAPGHATADTVTPDTSTELVLDRTNCSSNVGPLMLANTLTVQLCRLNNALTGTSDREHSDERTHFSDEDTIVELETPRNNYIVPLALESVAVGSLVGIIASKRRPRNEMNSELKRLRKQPLDRFNDVVELETWFFNSKDDK